MITNQYAYIGDGQRVSIVDSQGTKKPIWDGENLLLETDGMTIFVVYSCASDERSFSRPSRQEGRIFRQVRTTQRRTLIVEPLEANYGGIGGCHVARN